MRWKVAAVQTMTLRGEEEFRNAARAAEYVDRAVDLGARLISFPEGYPGPYSGPMDVASRLGGRRPVEWLQEKARQHRVYISCGELEPHPEVAGAYYLSHKLIGPDGEILGNYHRTQPNHPIFNAYLMGGKYHVLPGDRFVVVPTELGRIGLLICSELWVPELTRILMLLGAEVVIAPGGGAHSRTRTRLRDSWLCIARARAAENQLYVVVTQNVYPTMPRGGRTMVVGPEAVLAEVDGEGIAVAELDLERLTALRTRYYDEEVLSEPEDPSQVFACRPGQIHDRRPELYGLLVAPQRDAFNYRYHLQGLESYRVEYERVRTARVPSVEASTVSAVPERVGAGS